MRMTYDFRRGTNDNLTAARLIRTDELGRMLEARHARAWAVGDVVADVIFDGIRLVRAAVARFRAWRIARDNRLMLSALSSRELSDIGITRCDIPSILAGTFVRGGWLSEVPVEFNTNLRPASNDTGHPPPVRRRHRF
jgi:uncharacterized protein YjiS (DUF1127 family)